MKTLYLVRHGESVGNAQRVYQSAEDSQLSDKGREQALVLQKRFEGIAVDILYTSPLVRTMQTADIINKTLQVPVREDALLAEWGKPASLVGKLRDSKEAEEFEKARLSHIDQPEYKWEDEESVSEMRQRMTKFLNEMKVISQENILAVTHSHPLRAIAAVVLLGETSASNFDYHITTNVSTTNTGITVLQLKDDAKEWKLLTWNDHAHL